MGNGNFNIIAGKMNDRVTDLIFIRFALQQVEQTIFTDKSFSIVNDLQTRIQETIVPDQVFQKLRVEFKIPEYRFIGINVTSVPFSSPVFASFCSFIKTPLSKIAVFSLPSLIAVTLK
jgi:hypothetical protein